MSDRLMSEQGSGLDLHQPGPTLTRGTHVALLKVETPSNLQTL